MNATTFAALGEPSRLRIVELLRAGPSSVGHIAETLDIRQPQISKHLGVLRAAELVAVEPVARRRIYHLRGEPFAAIGRLALLVRRALGGASGRARKRSWFDARSREGTAVRLQLFKKELSFDRTYSAPIEPPRRLVYEARSWTEGEDRTYIEHVNELELSEDGYDTVLRLRITINDIGPGAKAKLAAFGMKWGYKAQLDKLEGCLAR